MSKWKMTLHRTKWTALKTGRQADRQSARYSHIQTDLDVYEINKERETNRNKAVEQM